MIPNDPELRKQIIARMISLCRNQSFTEPWEQDFVIKVEEQFRKKQDLSNRQCDILEQIYDKL
jgi:hypothetical protein